MNSDSDIWLRLKFRQDRSMDSAANSNQHRSLFFNYSEIDLKVKILVYHKGSPRSNLERRPSTWNLRKVYGHLEPNTARKPYTLSMQFSSFFLISSWVACWEASCTWALSRNPVGRPTIERRTTTWNPRNFGANLEPKTAWAP